MNQEKMNIEKAQLISPPTPETRQIAEDWEKKQKARIEKIKKLKEELNEKITWKTGGVDVKAPWNENCDENEVYLWGNRNNNDWEEVYFWFDKERKNGLLNLYNELSSSEWPVEQGEGSYEDCKKWLELYGFQLEKLDEE